MTDREIKNAIIEDAVISDAERGFLTATIFLNYGGSGQGFGNYALYLPQSFSHHKVNSPAGHFIWRVMEIAGVTRWNDRQDRTGGLRAFVRTRYRPHHQGRLVLSGCGL